MLAPNGELLAENVLWVIVVVPKFSTPPPPLPPAVLPTNVLSLMFSVVSLSIAPPPGPELPVNVSPISVSVPAALSSAPPPKMVAVLLLNVLLVTVAVFWLKIPPPSWAVLPVNVLVVTVSVPLLLIAPPEVPCAFGEELPENVEPETLSVPWLKMPPPPLTPSLARPLVILMLLSVRLPAEDTSIRRKEAELDRVIVAPLPWMVIRVLMTGRPVPPSVVLFAAVRV